MKKKRNYAWMQLVLDLKTVVILMFMIVWTIITIESCLNPNYKVPETVNLSLGGIIAYFTASKLKEYHDLKNGKLKK